MNAGDVLETRTFTVTRADLVAYADATGTVVCTGKATLVHSSGEQP